MANSLNRVSFPPSGSGCIAPITPGNPVPLSESIDRAARVLRYGNRESCGFHIEFQGIENASGMAISWRGNG